MRVNPETEESWAKPIVERFSIVLVKAQCCVKTLGYVYKCLGATVDQLVFSRFLNQKHQDSPVFFKNQDFNSSIFSFDHQSHLQRLDPLLERGTSPTRS